MRFTDRFIGRGAGLLATALVAFSLVVAATPAFAGTLTQVSWSVSNTMTGGTGITYAYSFRTATAGSIGSITMTVPTGTAGTPAVARNFGIGAGTVALAGTTITYTVTTPVTIAASIPIYLEFSGLTNTSTAGTSTSTVTTRTAAAATIDSGTSNSNAFSSGGVSTTIAVARSTVFSIDTNAFTLLLDPSVSTVGSQPINLGISSNAKNGYTLQCKVDKQPTGTTNTTATLSQFTAGMASAASWSTGGASQFGYSAAVTNNGNSGSPAPGGQLSGTNFAGFTVAGENCGSASGATGNPLATNLSGCGAGLCASAAHGWLINVRAGADYTTASDVYQNTITFTVTPSY
jgi:hypothetical protein